MYLSCQGDVPDENATLQNLFPEKIIFTTTEGIKVLRTLHVSVDG